MRAVARVVMNRVRAPGGEYARVGQGSLRKIIYQEGQFDCVREIVGGKPNNQLVYNMSPEQIHYDIAEWAMLGNRLTNLGQALWYFNPYSPQCRENFPSRVGQFVIRIGDHCFYDPTEYYFET